MKKTRILHSKSQHLLILEWVEGCFSIYYTISVVLIQNHCSFYRETGVLRRQPARSLCVSTFFSLSASKLQGWYTPLHSGVSRTRNANKRKSWPKPLPMTTTKIQVNTRKFYNSHLVWEGADFSALENNWVLPFFRETRRPADWERGENQRISTNTHGNLSTGRPAGVRGTLGSRHYRHSHSSLLSLGESAVKYCPPYRSIN